MTTEIRYNGSGIARIYLTPGAPIERLAIEELVAASGKGQTVSLVQDADGVAVLTVKNTKRAESEQAAE